MMKDITSVSYSKTGMDVSVYNVLILHGPVGNGTDWDVFGCIYTKDDDDPSIPDRVAVSIAVKGIAEIVASKLARGSIVSVYGKYGKFEKSKSGREKFRRIFCDISNVRVLGQVPL